jgi:hypothetical protein
MYYLSISLVNVKSQEALAYLVFGVGTSQYLIG